MNAAFLAGMSLAVAAPALKDRADPAALYGVWELERVAGGGQPGPPETAVYRYRFLLDGTYQVFRGARPPAGDPGRDLYRRAKAKRSRAAVAFQAVGAARRFRLDPRAGPPALDLNAHSADRGSPHVNAICRVEGDRLTICSAFPGKDRPTVFAAGSDMYLLHFRRVRPKD